MWKIGVLVAAVLLEITSAGVKTGVNHDLVQRLKRSPHYSDCGPPGRPPPPPPPPQFWPPPPPPPQPYWSLPPSPYRQQHHQPQPHQTYSNADSQAIAESASTRGDFDGGSNGEVLPQSCSTCGGHGSNAISNAQSGSGQAIAVAVAKSN